MNTKGKDRRLTAQKEFYKEHRTNIIYGSNGVLNIPVKPYSKPNQFQLHTATKKLQQITKGFTSRQYSSSYLQIAPKQNTQSTKAIIDTKNNSRDKSIELLEQKYIQVLKQVKQIKTERPTQKYVKMSTRNNYASKSPIKDQIKMNTELLKKNTQKFIAKKAPSISPIRARTPEFTQRINDDTQVNNYHRFEQRTPDSHTHMKKKMSYYYKNTTHNNIPSKSPSRNIKNNGNITHLYHNTNIHQHQHPNQHQHQHMITNVNNDAFSHYQYMSTKTKAMNNSKITINDNTIDTTTRNILNDYKKCSFINSTLNNSSSQKTIPIKKPNSFLNHRNNKQRNNINDYSCINNKQNENIDLTNQLLNNNIIQKNNKNVKEIKRDLIRLNKAKEVKESQRRNTIKNTIILPDEEQIDFNDLDQFSPPYVVDSINYDIKKQEKIFSPAGSTIFATIEMVNQEKQTNGTITTSSLHSSNNRQIIDNLIQITKSIQPLNIII